jgi:Coenzyme PQQ synthesis protein D (PqqD)
MMMAIRMTSPPRRRPDVKWKKVGRSGILLDLNSGDFFEVDEVGLSIWRLLDGKSSVEAVSGKLARSYSAPPATIEKDVRRFVSELRKRRLIEADGD